MIFPEARIFRNEYIEIVAPSSKNNNLWENDPTWRHDGGKGIEGRGVSGYPTRTDIRWQAEKGWSGLKKNSYITISDRA